MFNNEVFPVKEPNHIEDLKRLKLNVNKQHAKCQQQRNKNFEWNLPQQDVSFYGRQIYVFH